MIKPIEIDGEFEKLIPPLQDSELATLESSLNTEGCRDPLCVWEHGKTLTLLDGHNRYAICSRLKIAFRVQPISVNNRDDAKLWIIRNQFGRRNLTDAQRVDLALKAESVISEQAKANQGKRNDLCQKSDKSIDTKKELAKLAGVSHDTIHKQKFVRDNDPEKYAELIKPGSDLSINRAYLDVSQPIRREAKLKEIQENAKPNKNAKAIKQKAAVVLADPPWRYDAQETERRGIENQYPTMTTSEIESLSEQFADWTTDDCILFLWATSPKLAEAIGVMEAWGFAYTTCAVWDKEIIGQGYYFRQQHELLLIGKRGSVPTPLPSDRPSSIFRFRRGEHSAKPDYVYELLDKWYPTLSKLEMFARSPDARPGWMYWGNEA